MRVLFIISIIFGLSISTLSQELKLQGTVLDSLHRNIIADAEIKWGKCIAISDKNGKFEFNLNCHSVIKEPLIISHIAYHPDTILLSNRKKITILMRPKSHLIPEIEINSKPNIVFAPANTHVFDFEFYEDKLLILTYEKEQLFKRQEDVERALYKGCRLILANRDQRKLKEFDLPDNISGFHRAPEGKLWILGLDICYELILKNGNLELQEINLQDFNEKVLPLEEFVNNHIYFTDRDPTYPSLSHFKYDKIDSTSQKVRSVQNDFVMELFRSEYKYMKNRDKLSAIRMETEYGIDKEIIAAYMTGFPNSIYFEEVYAPLLKSGQKVYIFDHPNNTLFVHSQYGIPLDSLTMKFHRIKKQKYLSQIIRDDSSDKIYSLFQNKARVHIKEIDLNTARVCDDYALFYHYPEKIKIRDGLVYYLYRPFASPQTMHLYSEGPISDSWGNQNSP